ncbi:beta-N-acetylhexosaminidase [Cohnella luojiensis]|uniref:beta-N-acetylhexosaminidase n=1 Tax=Cohnella luojiensis TaxID=652876 RepID=A0A4Y8M6Z4_9BACL|nr:beta-N-acetylhexosaminidase [Cohnella luojiensis]TFE31766.1 beta-N-acetylhexosaminidase [Cohnella luojiensis]
MRHKVARCLGGLGISLILLLSLGCGLWRGGNAAEGSPTATPLPTATSSPTAIPPETPPSPTPTPTATPTPSEEDEIGNLLGGMTLEQKIGQMILAGVEGTSIDTATKKMISDQHVGGIILYKNNFSGLSGSVRFVNALKKANEGNPAPLFISVDQEGGKVSRLPKDFVSIPDAAKVGRTGNAELAKEMGSLLSKELKLMGFNVDFAPVLDINSNPKNPVIGNRSFGSTAKLVTKMGIAEMIGLREGGTIAVVKHFPGHGDTAVDSHLDLPVVNKTTEQLGKMEWIPFRSAIENGADAVMIAHILFPKIDPDAPASFSKVIIGEQLRGTLGYDGVVITDDMTMGAIADNYGIEDAAALSVEAGSDIILVAHGYDTEKKVFDKLMQAVKSGRIEESRIDQSVRRILALKLKYELSDKMIPIPTIGDLPNEEIRQWLEKL